MPKSRQPSALELAKQGNPRAIATLINRQLQPKGITAKASLKNGSLQILLEADSLPKQQVLVAAIQKFLTNLGADSIQKVKIYGKQLGEDIPNWHKELELYIPAPVTKLPNTMVSDSSPSSEPIPTQSETKVNIPNSGLNLDPVLKELAKQGDVKAISALISSQPQFRGITVRASLRSGYLQIVFISTNVPNQESSVQVIRQLVNDIDSSLIQKVKVTGMKEVAGSTNSKVLWNDEFESEMQSTLSHSEVHNVISQPNSILEGTTGSIGSSSVRTVPISERFNEGYEPKIVRYIKQGILLLSRFAISTKSTTEDPRLDEALEQLHSILVDGEMLEAWAVQRRIFALTNRRALIAATTGRFIALQRGLFGEINVSDFRWQDLREAKLRVGIFGIYAGLSLVTSDMSDLAMGSSSQPLLSETRRFDGFRKEQTQQVYRLAQAHDQAWREKRRIRELEELRAKSGGIQLATGAPPYATPTAPQVGDAAARLQQAKQMLDAKLISDSEYESIKARIISGV